MRCPIVLALLLDLAASAIATKCAAGYKHKADLSASLCSSAATDAAACNDHCCEKDVTKCGGLSVTCSSDKYADITDEWKNTAATEETKNTACCKEKSICGSGVYTCPAGTQRTDATAAFKAGTGGWTIEVKNAWKSGQCPGGPNTCVETCCTKDDTTCGGATAQTCDGNYYKLADKEMGDGWKKTKIIVVKAAGTETAAEKKTNYQVACCGVKQKCGSTLYSCPAGQKRKASNTNTACTGGADKCKTECCEKDKLTCGGLAVSCGGNLYNPAADIDKATGTLKSESWAKKPTTSTTKDHDCCTSRATCANAICGAGFRKKAKSDSLFCPNHRDSCATEVGLCCERDPNTCGGQTSLACAYGLFDERSTWILNGPAALQTKKAVMDAWKSRNTTAKTKNTECCSPRAICKYEALGTTTPSPVVTTTPAAPVRRYSEHMLAVKKDSDQPHADNLVWLAVGGFFGMVVLMAVQGLRSTTTARFASLE